VKVTGSTRSTGRASARRTKAGFGTRNSTRRAIVTVKEGDRIDISETGFLMGIRKYKPTTPGRRGSSVADFVEILARRRRSLWCVAHSKGGRNAAGRITTRHQGWPQARLPGDRLPSADKDGVPAKVAHIEYDPNRTARIALLHFADGEKRYIICPNKLSQGDTIETGPARTSSRGTTCR